MPIQVMYKIIGIKTQQVSNTKDFQVFHYDEIATTVSDFPILLHKFYHSEESALRDAEQNPYWKDKSFIIQKVYSFRS